MKRMRALLPVAMLFACANAMTQTVTIHVKNVPVEKVMSMIRSQTNCFFAYSPQDLHNLPKVSLSLDHVPLATALDSCFRNLPLTYVMVGKIITITPRSPKTTRIPPKFDITGKVTSEKGEPLEGVSVSINGGAGTITNAYGEFLLPVYTDNARLHFSYVGYETTNRIVHASQHLPIVLKLAVKDLDEAVIIAYGVISQRLNTGSVSKISGTDIEKQPVGNLLAAIQGRVSGLLVTQSSGLPGASFSTQLRGQNSIGSVLAQTTQSEPFYIIDGVPFAPNNLQLANVASGTAFINGRSPFNSINPQDVASIEVLKDADATAIYGSRGANGVVLISTKKGTYGKPVFNMNLYNGYSQVTRRPQFLDTQQYLAMRREALANDSITPNTSNAFDLLLWDTARYTDFSKLLIGNTAHVTDVYTSLTGGSLLTRYYFSAGYRHETTVFPGSLSDNRAGFHLNGTHYSKDKKFAVGLNVNYSSDKNHTLTSDLTQYANTIPNAPLYDKTGHIAWEENGKHYQNPLRYLQMPYTATTNNFIAGVELSYKPIRNVLVRLNAGYNSFRDNELAAYPRSAQDSINTRWGFLYEGNNNFSSAIIEPQVEYGTALGKGRIKILTGATWQWKTNDLTNITAQFIASDSDLYNINAAGEVLRGDASSLYKYQAVFARINYNLYNRYILNLTGRRDGSSRFGPNRQFGNFGAAGAAWIFSEEQGVKKSIPALSYGKLRASYGITGNDQIGDYGYYDQWDTAASNYQGVNGVIPVRTPNNNYGWEVNRKLEAALELGWFNNRVLLTAAYYRNRSSNLLIDYRVSAVAGINRTTTKNSDAIVQNTGLELTLQTKNIIGRQLGWTSNFNFTLPHNKLVQLPSAGLTDNYYYIYNLIPGQPLSTLMTLHYTGVDPTTGLFTVRDLDGNGSFSYPNDYINAGTRDAIWYGGLQNSLVYKNCQLDVFVEFRKQQAEGFWLKYLSASPGSGVINLPMLFLQRWQRPGDHQLIQRLTTKTGTETFTALQRFIDSDGRLTDASYLRIKNIIASYTLPNNWMKRLHLKTGSLYVQAQNLFTISRLKYTDPETHNLYSLPPLKIVTAGIRLGF